MNFHETVAANFTTVADLQNFPIPYVPQKSLWKIKYECFFFLDKIIIQTSWYSNGVKRAENIFCNSSKIVERRWYLNGTKKFERILQSGRMHGKRTSWHINGNLKCETYYIHGLKDGKSTSKYRDGTDKYEISYKMGKKHGSIFLCYPNGQKALEGNNIDGKKGDWQYWSEDGTPIEELIFSRYINRANGFL